MKLFARKLLTILPHRFFESFSNNYEETSNVEDLVDKLKATLTAQTNALQYKKEGEAYIDKPSGKDSTTLVDEPTKLHTGNLIKVGRDKKADKVYDYASAANNVFDSKTWLV